MKLMSDSASRPAPRGRPGSWQFIACLAAGRCGHQAARHVLDKDEIELPFDKLTIFESLESSQRMLVDPQSIRKLYEKRMRDFLASSENRCLAAGVEYHLATTDRPFEATVLSFLAKRLGIAEEGEAQWA